MAKVIYIVDTYIIAKITTDDGAVVQANRQTEIMKFEVKRFQFADPDQSIKFTVLYQFGIKSGGNKYLIPVI